jgi:hypothetical protein
VSRRRRFAAPAFSLLAALCGCERSAAPGPAPTAPAPRSEVAITPVVAPSAASLYGEDPSGLRYRGRGDEETVVWSADGAYVSVGEFNAWLGTYPLRITSDDPSAAQRQALEQLVTFKLLVEKARASGYEERLGPGSDPRSLAFAYIRDQIGNIASVSDEAAREYEAAHPEALAHIDPDEVPAQVRTMAIKGSIRGEQLWTRVQEWMAEEGIRYEEAVR